MFDVKHRSISEWKKELYYCTYHLIHDISKRWTGNDHDLVIQYACMDTDSYIQIHRDRDVSSKFVLSFCEYSEGGNFVI